MDFTKEELKIMERALFHAKQNILVRLSHQNDPKGWEHHKRTEDLWLKVARECDK